MGIQDPDIEAQLMPDDSNGLQEIRVIGDQHGSSEVVLIGIIDKVGGYVDVRALFLRTGYPCESWASRRRFGQRQHDIMREKRSVHDFKVWKGSEGA